MCQNLKYLLSLMLSLESIPLIVIRLSLVSITDSSSFVFTMMLVIFFDGAFLLFFFYVLLLLGI